MCRAPVAPFGSVYVHVAAVIAACIVCIVLFMIVTIRRRQWRSIGKTSARASDTKGRIAQKNRLQRGRLALHREINCKEKEEGKGSIEVWCAW